MEYRTITRLAEIMAKHGLTELEVSEKDFSVRLNRQATVAAQPVVAAAAQPAAVAAVSAEAAAPVKPAVAEATCADAMFITSPMPGTFYSSSSPNAPAYVSVGDLVKVGQPVGIVEAMKVMNEIKSEVAGVVTKNLIANGAPVEYGQKLFEISPAS